MQGLFRNKNAELMRKLIIESKYKGPASYTLKDGKLEITKLKLEGNVWVKIDG